MGNVTEWQKVVFSDESRFVLGTNDNRERVWRRTGPFLNGLPGQCSSKIMLVRIQQELVKISYVIFRLFHVRPAPRLVPCRARVGSVKTADAIASRCT
ncbi:hypothetical protein TNCV_3415401 [Trichonephila clavipes]|nr:hypothetical protein TNCV_3415401 [Trichonephila clavipes]